jgi:hypothetical protein
MDYGEILGTAWKTIWKHKVLWIFGILAGCARGGGGGGTGGGSGWRNNLDSGSSASPEIQRYMANIGQWIVNNLWVVVALALLFVVLIILAIFLGTIGRIALIRGVFRVDGGAERLAFGELFQESRAFFWRVFGLSIAVGLAFLIVLAPIIAVGALTAGVGFLCLLPVICLLVPLAWIAGVIVQQADVAIVTEDLSLMDGARRAWILAKKNLGPLLIIWLITVVIGFVGGILIALPVLIVVIPAAIAFAAGGGQFSTTPLIIGGLCLVVYLPILLVANGILTAYLQSVWALTYLRLTKIKKEEQTPPALPSNA